MLGVDFEAVDREILLSERESSIDDMPLSLYPESRREPISGDCAAPPRTRSASSAVKTDLEARGLAWCWSCEGEGQAEWRAESFRKRENRAEARFLRGVEVCKDEELERTEWAAEELEAMESRWAVAAEASSMAGEVVKVVKVVEGVEGVEVVEYCFARATRWASRSSSCWWSGRRRASQR